MSKKGLNHVFKAHTQDEKENRRRQHVLHFLKIKFTKNAETIYIRNFLKFKVSENFP